jgi:hypothetical protein
VPKRDVRGTKAINQDQIMKTMILEFQNGSEFRDPLLRNSLQVRSQGERLSYTIKHQLDSEGKDAVKRP